MGSWGDGDAPTSMIANSTRLTDATVELLQLLIRNRVRQRRHRGLGRGGAQRRRAPAGDRGPRRRRRAVRGGARAGVVVARIEGSDPTAPRLCLMGHTDVVPVNAAGWSEDPFGGEIIDGRRAEVWGRGAVDMLNLTASMAVAFRSLADSGFRPTGDLIYFGVADEEAGSAYGARWMAEHHARRDPCRLRADRERRAPQRARPRRRSSA